jgi:hypothetical protein
MGRERAFGFTDGSCGEVGKDLLEDKHSSYDGLLDRVGRKVDGGTHG